MARLPESSRAASGQDGGYSGAGNPTVGYYAVATGRQNQSFDHNVRAVPIFFKVSAKESVEFFKSFAFKKRITFSFHSKHTPAFKKVVITYRF